MNESLDPTKENLNPDNSSMVKNVSKLNGDIAKYVPKNVLSALKAKFN